MLTKGTGISKSIPIWGKRLESTMITIISYILEIDILMCMILPIIKYKQ